jgi:hypothetical protein
VLLEHWRLIVAVFSSMEDVPTDAVIVGLDNYNSTRYIGKRPLTRETEASCISNKNLFQDTQSNTSALGLYARVPYTS